MGLGMRRTGRKAIGMVCRRRLDTPSNRFSRRALGFVVGLLALAVGEQAQAQGPPPFPPREPAWTGGPLRRAVRHTKWTIHDQLVGYPAYFNVPPLGTSLYNNMTTMTRKGDMHTFVLYRSDFLSGTTTLSPGGARRLSFMASRLPGWGGPVVVEWTPDQPGLDVARREAVASILMGANLPVTGERLVVGPSPYPGLLGADAANNYDVLITRDLAAPRTYSLSPASTASFGGGAR